jgi:hypothetical protein
MRSTRDRTDASNLSAFSAMVHMISGASHKLVLRLGLGDGAFPKRANMRQKAPFDGAIHRVEDATNEPSGDGVESRVKNVTNEPTSDSVENRKRDKRTHRRRAESRKRDERTHRPPCPGSDDAMSEGAGWGL